MNMNMNTIDIALFYTYIYSCSIKLYTLYALCKIIY